MKLRAKHGHTLIETLVVLAIIAILMALYLPTLAKAMRKAKEVAGKEALRQEGIGRLADGANAPYRDRVVRNGRAEAREAFRYELDIGKGDKMIVSELLYVVKNDDEFRAYYHTLLNPANNAPLQFGARGELLARDEENNAYLLPPMDTFPGRGEPRPQMWEFISTDLTETSSGTLGANVIYTDGHAAYVRYPSEFPMTQTVAALSHAFMQTL